MNDGLKVLLVEDDADTRASLGDILELDGHQVLVAESLHKARQIVEAHEGCDCVVILDRNLPDGTADEFLPELKRLAPNAETIVVTGFADLNSTISALRSGVADYLIKPINPDALRACLHRITERRRVKAALQVEQQFAGRILETAEAVVLVLDLDGGIVRFNPYFETITGWNLGNLVGKNWFTNCIPPEEREQVQTIFFETAQHAESDGIINSILTSDGRMRQLRWSNTTLKDENGVTTSVLAVGIDVTDFALAQERVLQSERLAAIGQTMTAIAHESRNALQRISAGVEMLELDLQSNRDSYRDLQAIKRAANDLDQLLEEVRSFAAPIVLSREQASLPEIWRRAWRQLSVIRQGRDAELQEQIGCDDRTVNVDVVRLEQVFRNLFDNSLAACDDPVCVSVAYSFADGFAEIVVSDDGPGLTCEQREKIFDAFYTTKSSGTGLGMSIVQRIIEAHQGTIDISEVDQHAGSRGAVFVIRLPMHPTTKTSLSHTATSIKTQWNKNVTPC